MSIGITDDKAPIRGTGYRSDGETIPWVSPAGGEKVGDVLTRSATEQAIGVVQSLSANDMTKGATTGDANTGYSTESVASAGSELQVRIYGMFYFPAANATYTDGDLVSWGGTEMGANATGAHQVVGTSTVDGTSVTHILCRINVVPRAAT